MFVSELHLKYLPPNFRFYTKNEQNLQRGEWEAGHLMLGSHLLNDHEILPLQLMELTTTWGLFILRRKLYSYQLGLF